MTDTVPGAQDRITSGKFAHGIQFITDGANHACDGFSTFPFAIHDPARFMVYPNSPCARHDHPLNKIAWWEWPIAVILANETATTAASLAVEQSVADNLRIAQQNGT